VDCFYGLVMDIAQQRLKLKNAIPFLASVIAIILLLSGTFQKSGPSRFQVLLSGCFFIIAIGILMLYQCKYFFRVKSEINQKEDKQTDSAVHARNLCFSKLGHEIRTPMNAILGFLQLLQDDQSLGQDQREYLTIIYRSSEKLVSIINDVLELSRIANQMVCPKNQSFNFESLLNELLQKHASPECENNLFFTISGESAFPGIILSDREICWKVLNKVFELNLFVAANKVVTISTSYCHSSEKENKVTVFTDIELPDIETYLVGSHSIFEPFNWPFSDRNSLATGLELPIAREYARLINGDLYLKTHENERVFFRFEFTAETVPEPIQENVSSVENRSVSDMINHFERRIVGKHDSVSESPDIKFAAVPNNIRTELINAVQRGDMDRFAELLDDLAGKEPDIAATLKYHADNYDYDALLLLLNRRTNNE
jgi:hypothetical protein